MIPAAIAIAILAFIAWKLPAPKGKHKPRPPFTDWRDGR